MLGLISCRTPEPLKSEWQKEARVDLEFIHKFISENHPGVLVSNDETFQSWLKIGQTEALRHLGNVHSERDYIYFLVNYLNGFKEQHIGIRPQKQLAPAFRWPGFSVMYLDGRVVVVTDILKLKNDGATQTSEVAREARLNSFSSANVPPPGAEIVSCDGNTVAQLLQNRVNPFRPDKRVEDLADILRESNILFLDMGDPFVRRSKKCAVSEQGKTREITLNWQPLPNQMAAEVFGDLFRGHAGHSIGLNRIGGNGLWVNLPTFNVDQKTSVLFQTLVANLKKAKSSKPKYIVFDLRGNTGGTVAYFSQIIKAIYGDRISDKIRRCDSRGIQVLRRTTPATIAAYAQKAEDTKREYGENSDIFGVLNGLKNQLDEAASQGHEYVGTPLEEIRSPLGEYKQGKDCVISPQERGDLPRPVVLFDYFCASACPMFMDGLDLFSDLIRLGQPSPLRDQYMESAEVELPSGLASLGFPTMYERRTQQRSFYHPRFWIKLTHASDEQVMSEVSKILKKEFAIQR